MMNKAMQSKFVVRDLKVHSSDEWMADNTKKYRRVFDRYELRYIYVEFSFFNKLYDEEDWEVDVTLECTVKTTTPVKLCSLRQNIKVSKAENIVYIRDSWGKPTAGEFWKMGDFRWEVIINNSVVAETTFHVEDLGPEALPGNGYIMLKSLKLFESDAAIKNEAERKNYSVFKRDETRYVCAEVIFSSQSEKGFYTELIFHYLDHTGLLKGKSAELIYVKVGSQNLSYTVTSGWGNNTPGMWLNKYYSLEIYCMEQLLVRSTFEMGDKWVEADDTTLPKLPVTDREYMRISKEGEMPGRTAEDSLEENLSALNNMTGLDDIKNEVNEMVTLVKFYRETGKDILNKFSLHSVFTGNPGTGKTTVARLLSKVYKGMGILEKGHLVEADREALVAGYIGQTAAKTKAKLDEALGGILFIDEAYSLAGRDLSDNDFGNEAIATVLKYMEDHRGKIGLIVAGYPENMKDFIDSNPGLRSRFDKYFRFPDYKPGEMWNIAVTLFGIDNVLPDEAAAAHLKKYLIWLFENRDSNFGNARTVRQIVTECIKNQHLRLAVMRKEDRTAKMLRTIIWDDVKEFDMNDADRWGVSRKRSTIGFRKSET